MLPLSARFDTIIYRHELNQYARDSRRSLHQDLVRKCKRRGLKLPNAITIFSLFLIVGQLFTHQISA